MIEPQNPEDPPREMVTNKRRPDSAREAIRDVEKYGAPYGSFRERKRPQTYCSYMDLLLDIIDAKVVEKKVWKVSMFKEYQLIMKKCLRCSTKNIREFSGDF